MDTRWLKKKISTLVDSWNSTYNETYTNLADVKEKKRYTRFGLRDILGPQIEATNKITRFLKQTNVYKFVSNYNYKS